MPVPHSWNQVSAWEETSLLKAGDQKIKKKKEKYKITGMHDSLSYDPVAILKI